MEGKVNNVVRIPSSLNGDFFKYWLLFLKPFHKLAAKEMEVAAFFLKKHRELSKVISDDTILNKMLMSEDTKAELKKECNLTSAYMSVILNKLRKAGFLTHERINPKLIPNIDSEGNSVQLLLYFDFNV